jgi:hypothetical protein
MSYQEKKSIVSMFSSAIIFGAYCWYVFLRYQDELFGSEVNYRFWGAVILILIPVSIAAKIVVSIVFIMLNRMATKEIEPSFEDELDKLIESKATRVSHYVFVFGFILAMGALVLEQPISVMFVILFFAGYLSEATGLGTQLYLYRRGV